MRLTAIPLYCFVVLAGLLLTGCRKHAPEPPYFRFSAEDRRWMQHREGDEWRFSNGQGQQRVYRVSRIYEKLKQEYDCCPVFGPTLPLPGSGSGVRYYYDTWAFRFERTDSANVGNGSIQFQRPVSLNTPLPEKAPATGGLLGVSGYLLEYIGSPDQFGRPGCSDLEWQSDTTDVNLRPHAPLVVGGQRYDYVLTFTAGGNPSACAATGLPRPRIRRVYYDRQYGIVRMESVTGEVWDRVR
ncbi:hypothetical protein EJV47_15160 [Hymenobacter gummosus]|uniref:Uncharacterized protein n=1 Tax=Hymenobacter gummosus TaxID=1776032 RepID=A0A3S0H8J1_9BACT|nr:hypothetical protein [Hymenobacter gummosus]RTQ48930.1 hypothetical protein EJV47_15160 [Hymenobacter gummosus]